MDLAEEADLHFQLGVEAYAAGDFRLALERMLRANRLVPNRNVVFNIALCYEALGDYDEAYRSYAQTLASESDSAQQRSIREAMEKLQARVALLEITSSPPGATVFIDRADLGGRGVTPLVLALPPGEHEVILKLDGYETASVRAAATRGEAREVSRELEQLVGVVKITGEAGFDVFHGESETPLCTTPCEVGLPLGQQTLKIMGEGYRPQVSVANLPTPGSVVTIEAAPVRLTGTLRVDSNVDDALVRVDGQPVGYTPLIAPIVTGARTVVVEADGFAPYQVEAAVRDGEVSDLGSVRLLPLSLVVSASRVEEDIFEAPSSVSLVDAGEIEAFGYPTLQEALRGTRGVTSIRNELDSMIMVRGVGTAANRGTQSKTLLNGVPLTDQLTGRQYLYSRSRNIQSIEVQRGSGSVLYGSGALTSLVSVRTRGRMEGTESSVSAGTFGNEGRASVSGSTGTDDYGVRVYAGGVHGEGGAGTIPYSVVGGEPRPRPTAIDDDAPWQGGNIDLTAWAKDLEIFAQYAEDQVEVTSGAEGSVLTNLRGRSVTNGQRIRQLTLSASYRPELSERTEIDLNVHYRQSLFDNEATWQRSTAGVQLELLADQRAAARWVGGTGQVITRPIDGLRIVSGAEIYRSAELSLEQATRIYLPAERRYADTEARLRPGSASRLLSSSTPPTAWPTTSPSTSSS